MIEARFTPVQNVPAYFSIGMRQIKGFVVQDNGADLSSVSGWTWELGIKKNAGSQKTIISLTLGNGLAYAPYTSYTLVSDFSDSQTSIEEGEYFWYLKRTDIPQIWISGPAFFSYKAPSVGYELSDDLVLNIVDQTLTVNLNASTVLVATQTEVNTGNETSKYVSPSTLKNKDGDSVALTDAATIDLTSDKHTLTTALGRAFTNSFVGDFIVIRITLNATSATFTFPAGYLCAFAGTASGDNTLPITGATSGDRIDVAILKIGSSYSVAAINMGQ